VYGFVKQSEGHLTAESQLDYGTTIEMHLPVARSAQKKSADSATNSISPGNQTILVVEDEADVRGIAIAFLRAAGYVVLAADNANAALALVAEEPAIALVFSDVVLGSGLSGVDLAQAARRLRPRLPILLTSGYEHAALDGDGSAAEEFELLQKPYTREKLIAAIRAVLDRR
jgi:DNA-binding NtrC family response regulator